MDYEYKHKPQVRNIYITAYKRLGGELLERFKYEDLPMRMAIKWGWFFKYRHALLQVKYPKAYIQTQHYNVEPEGRTLERIEADKIKREITTCKRMITKLSNAISHFESIESQTLIPNWYNPSYLKAKQKLSNYISKLELLTKST